jgi:hypothetical protein
MRIDMLNRVSQQVQVVERFTQQLLPIVAASDGKKIRPRL